MSLTPYWYVYYPVLVCHLSRTGKSLIPYWYVTYLVLVSHLPRTGKSLTPYRYITSLLSETCRYTQRCSTFVIVNHCKALCTALDTVLSKIINNCYYNEDSKHISFTWALLSLNDNHTLGNHMSHYALIWVCKSYMYTGLMVKFHECYVGYGFYNMYRLAY